MGRYLFQGTNTKQIGRNGRRGMASFVKVQWESIPAGVQRHHQDSAVEGKKISPAGGIFVKKEEKRDQTGSF